MKRVVIFILGILVSFTIGAQNQPVYTFMLVHGSWHGDWVWFQLEYELTKAGHKVICINLPGHGIDTINPGQVTLIDYQNAIVTELDKQTGSVVLVGHSMGGIAISMAAEARPDKIDKLVYLAAFLIPKDSSMLSFAVRDTFSMILPSVMINQADGTVELNMDNIEDVFYSESTENYTILSRKLLRPDPLLPLVTPLKLTDANYGSVRRFYIETTYDRAITPAMQEYMYTNIECEEVFTLHTEHSPFFSGPKNLKNILIKIAKDDDYRKVGISTISDKPLLTFNYSKPYLTIWLNKTIISSGISEVRIYSLSGKLLKGVNFKENTSDSQIDISGLNPGIYFVTAIVNRKVYSGKFLVE